MEERHRDSRLHFRFVRNNRKGQVVLGKFQRFHDPFRTVRRLKMPRNSPNILSNKLFNLALDFKLFNLA